MTTANNHEFIELAPVRRTTAAASRGRLYPRTDLQTGDDLADRGEPDGHRPVTCGELDLEWSSCSNVEDVTGRLTARRRPARRH